MEAVFIRAPKQALDTSCRLQRLLMLGIRPFFLALGKPPKVPGALQPHEIMGSLADDFGDAGLSLTF